MKVSVVGNLLTIFFLVCF